MTSGISWRSRRGTAPRLVETPAGALYVRGTATMGIDVALRRYARLWAARVAAGGAPVIVSLLGSEPGEYALAATELQGVPGVCALELDLTVADEATGAPLAADPLQARRTLAAVRRACTLPLLLKLPADLPNAEETLRAAAGGADGATVGAGLLATARTAEGALLHGRLVGPATFPVVLDLIAGLAPDAPLPVIACGGVTTGAAAEACLRAGAAAVQVGAAHLADPTAARSVLASLAAT